MKPGTADLDFKNTEKAFSHQSDSELRKAFWMFSLMNKRWLVQIGSLLTKFALKIHLPIQPLIRETIFQHFCGGETIQECQKTIHKLSEKGVGTILDYSVEGEDDEATFDATLVHLLQTVQAAAGSKDIPFAVFKVTGLGSASILEKIQNQTALTKDESAEFERVRQRIYSLCGSAYEHEIRIFFDAEESWIQDTIDQLCYEMMSLFNKQKPIVFNTFQFYRKDMLENYHLAYENAKQNGYFLGGKLVRGAYLEKEAEYAARQGQNNPLHQTKEAVDKDYDHAVSFSLAHLDLLAICLGTHNEHSCLLCVKKMQEHAIDKKDERIYFAQLLGMSDNISFNMARAGYNVAKYVPFGPIDAVMPYLFRRANENTAIAGQSSREFLLVREELTRRKKAII